MFPPETFIIYVVNGTSFHLRCSKFIFTALIYLQHQH